MKTNFEKVKAICDSGKIAVVETIWDGEITFFAFFKTALGDYKYGTNETKELSLEDMGEWTADEDLISILNIVKIHNPISFPPHNIQEGDKVRILECTRHINKKFGYAQYDDEMLNMIGKVFEVVGIMGYGEEICVRNNIDEDNFEHVYFPLSCVCLDWED